MAKAHALRVQYAQMIQAMKRVLKDCLDKLVVGILYDDWNPMILNNRLCFRFQAIPDMELRGRAADSWKGYRSTFYAEYHKKWNLQGRESPAVESILMSLRQEFKGPKWDMEVNKLISLSTEKRFCLMAEGKHVEAEALNNAVRNTVARITDYGLGSENVGFEFTHMAEPTESKTSGKIGEGVVACAKTSTLHTDCILADGNLGFEWTAIMHCGLGDSVVGTESPQITQVTQPLESTIKGQVGEEVFANTKKSEPRTDYGLGDGVIGIESTQITKVPKPTESNIEGQIGDQVFAYTRKSKPRTDYGSSDRDFGFESTQITQVPQPNESKTKGQISEEVFAYAKKSKARKGYGLSDGGVAIKPIQIAQVPQRKERKTKGQIGEDFFAYAEKSTPRTDYALGDENVESKSILTTAVG